MRVIITIIIVVITSAVGVLAYMLSSPEYRSLFFTENIDIRQTHAFPNLEPADIRTVEITNNEGVKGTFTYNPKTYRWTATAPWKDRATNLAPIISFAKETIVQEVIPIKDAKLEDLGLGSLGHRITFKNAKNQILADFKMGATSTWQAKMPKGEKEYPCVYLRDLTKGNDAPSLLCVDPQIKTHLILENRLVRLRDYKPIFPYDVRALTQLHIKTKDSTIELERRRKATSKAIPSASADSWMVKKPLELRADKLAIGKLLNTLKFITAKEILDKQSVLLPENDENLIELQLYYYFRKTPVTLKIYPSTRKNNITLATVSDRSNVVFQLPAQAVENVYPEVYTNLPKNVNDVRAKNLLSLNYKIINLVTIIPKDREPVNLRRKKNWEIMDSATGKPIPINQKTHDNFFYALTQNTIVKFVSDAPSDLKQYGLEDPRLQVYIVDRYNNPQKLMFGNPVGYEVDGVKQKGFYAKSSSQQSVWVVSSSVLSRIKQNNWEWLPLDITGISRATIKEITRDRINKPIQHIKYDYSAETLEVREGTEQISSKNPIVTPQIDVNRCNYFMQKLCDLKALNRLSPRSVAAWQALKQPCLKISILFQDFDTGLPKQIKLVIAPAGNLQTTNFFYVKEETSGQVFDISREAYFDLQDSIRYVR